MQFQRRYEVALSLIREWPILDVGGGDGSFLFFAVSRGILVASSVCVDIEMKPFDIGKSLRNIKCSFWRKDITTPFGYYQSNPRYRGCRWPTAIAFDVLEHLRDPIFTLQEMLGVAKEVVIVVPNFSYWKQRYQVLRGTYPSLMRPSRKHCYWMNPRIVSGLVKEAGGIIDEWKYSYPVRLGRIGRILANNFPGLFAPGIGVRIVKCKS